MMKKILLVLGCILLSTSLSYSAVPSQFVAKVYTEACGRIPDQNEFKQWSEYFSESGVTVKTLQYCAEEVIRNDWKYRDTNGYTAEEQILTLYRALLSRDPDQDGFTYWKNKLKNKKTIVRLMVRGLLGGDEFGTLLPSVAAGESYGWRSENRPLDLPVDSSGDADPGMVLFSGEDGDDLQELLDNHGPDVTVVAIRPRKNVLLSRRLVVPEGITLCTFTGGATTITSDKCASFARLYRGSSDGWDMITLKSGARLKHIWIDGQESVIGRQMANNPGVYVPGGKNTTVEECFFCDVAGWTNILLHGSPHVISPKAENIVIHKNCITCYNTVHLDRWDSPPDPAPWCDGITCSSESTVISSNGIVDATDVGIVVMATGNGDTPQNSQVLNNTVITTGNSVFAGINLINAEDIPYASFKGSRVEDNLLWTGGNAHMDIALCVGGKPFFSKFNPIYHTECTGNTSGVLSVRCNVGVAVCNVTDATVLNNRIHPELINTTGVVPVCVVGVQRVTVTGLVDDFAGADSTFAYEHFEGALTDGK